MRAFALFAAGTIVGLGVTAAAQSVSPNHGIVGLSFVGVSVPNLDKAVEYYIRKHTGNSLRQGSRNSSWFR